jgi:hypothetical protein
VLFGFGARNAGGDAPLDGALPDVFEKDLGELSKIVVLLYRQVEHDDFAVKRILGLEIDIRAKLASLLILNRMRILGFEIDIRAKQSAKECRAKSSRPCW